MSNRLRLVGATVAAAVLVGTARRAHSREVSDAEERTFRVFNDAPEFIHLPVWAVMQAGSLAAVGVTAGGLVQRGRPRVAAAAAISGMLVWGGVKAVKPTVGRGRPERHLHDVSVRGREQSGLGYPSGHAAVSLTLALISSENCSPSVRTAALAVAAITGGARMYMGAHLPLDVVGGYAIGTLCGQLTNAAIERGLDGGR
jgi:membrane-associated phospholipid phosphatase